MSLRRYYQLSLITPIVIPVLALPFAVAPKNWLSMAAMVLVHTLIIGGIPYLLFAVGVLCLFRQRSTRELHKFSFVSPVVYSVLLLLYCGALVGGAGAFFAAWGLAFGYAYVAIVHAVRALLQRSGYLAEGSAACGRPECPGPDEPNAR